MYLKEKHVFSRCESYGLSKYALDILSKLNQNILKDAPSQALRYNIERKNHGYVNLQN